MSNSPISIKLLGHEFLAMTAVDFQGLGGAPAGSYVCEIEDTVLVASPVGTWQDGNVRWQVVEIRPDGTEVEWRASPAK